MSIRGLAVGCLVSLVMACGHDASRGWEPLLEPEEGVRTKGGDTFTSRIPVAIANGEWTEAEALITEALGMGLVAKAQADRWREQVRRLKEEEQRAGPGRSPPTGPRAPTADGLPRDEERTCGTEWPDHPLCAALPDEYTFATPQAALEAMKRRLEQKNLTLHRPEDATGGPCPDVGQHYNVRMNGDRWGPSPVARAAWTWPTVRSCGANAGLSGDPGRLPDGTGRRSRRAERLEARGRPG